MINGASGPATRNGQIVRPARVGVASMQPDLLYYRRRQAEEAAAAVAARDPKVGAVHRELARKYDEYIRELEPAGDTIIPLISAA